MVHENIFPARGLIYDGMVRLGEAERQYNLWRNDDFSFAHLNYEEICLSIENEQKQEQKISRLKDLCNKDLSSGLQNFSWETRAEIRSVYGQFHEEIMESTSIFQRFRLFDFIFECSGVFSKFENHFNLTRGAHRFPLLPQYPVANYFLDYANPFFKVGIELDGRMYHDERKERDRDDVLSNEGWTVFHLHWESLSEPHGYYDGDHQYPNAREYFQSGNIFCYTDVQRALATLYDFSTRQAAAQDALLLLSCVPCSAQRLRLGWQKSFEPITKARMRYESLHHKW